MAVKMRLTRLGDKKSPFYRIVVADSRKARDGEYVDLIGTYNPLVSENDVNIDLEKAKKWIANGAQPTDTVKTLLLRTGAIEPKKPAAKETKKAAKTTAKTTTKKAAK